MRQVLKCLGIKWSMSTVYHLRTDSQIEQLNQEVEQYLHLLTSYSQNDWVDWLSIVEFIHNIFITITGLVLSKSFMDIILNSPYLRKQEKIEKHAAYDK
jgi:transposase InsO family protein